MARLSFQIDDPELLDFVYSLGRERSKVLRLLLRDCMEEGGGYVPPRVMAETGFSYKGKKAMKGSSAKREKGSVKKPTYNKERTHTKIQKAKEDVVADHVESVPEPQIEAEVVTETKTDAVSDDVTYVSHAPEIKNKELVMKGLSGFF